MSYTLAELRDWVRELADLGLAELFTDASVDRLINATYGELWQLDDWPFTYQVAALGTDSAGVVQLPADLRRIESVQLTADKGAGQLVPAGSEPGWHDWVRPLAVTGDTTDNGSIPCAYSTYGGLLAVWPATATQLVVRYQAGPAKLAADTDEPVFPGEFHEALAYGTAARVLRQEADDTKRSESYQAEYETIINRMRDRLRGGTHRPFDMSGDWVAMFRPRGGRY